ncbi:MAG: beta strand repeat-containing protein [Caulobacterales bacterium]
MATELWGNINFDPLAIDASAGNQTSPAIADNAGTEFGVAYLSGNAIIASFYDELGRPNPALPTVTVNDATGASLRDIQISAGGLGIGYGVGWTETNTVGATQVEQFKFRFIGLGAIVGATELYVAPASTNASQHDIAIGGYSIDDPVTRRPIVEGFDAAWVEGPGGAHALGNVVLQRIAVPLDARKDPSGPPALAGIDGQTTGGNSARVLGNGRDPSVATLHGTNEFITTYIDSSGRIVLKIFDNAGNDITSGATGATSTNINAGRPVAAGDQQHVVALAGGGFAVVWLSVTAGDKQLFARVYSPGAAAGTWTSPALLPPALDVLSALGGQTSNAIADFALAAHPDDGGFSVSWQATGSVDGVAPPTTIIYSKSFDANGAPNEAQASAFASPASGVATTGLVGDRVVAVYQDVTAPGNVNLTAKILDTRFIFDADGLPTPITLGGPGVTITGDVGGRVIPDVLVGSIGNDTIDGGGGNDILDGARGNDTIAAGVGDDQIDGGGESDTVTFTGRYTQDGNAANDDYIITALGGGIFTISDKRAGADGTDTIRDVENFFFAGSNLTFTAAALSGLAPNVTPTAWGWTNVDLDSNPNADGTPDVDGFMVNRATDSLLGYQGAPVVSDQVGENIAVAWESAATVGGQTRIRAQLYDVIGGFDAGFPNAVNLSDGIGFEINPVISSGGANSGWAFTFEERDSPTDFSRALKTNFLGPVALTSQELFVKGEEGQNVDQHDAAVFGSFLNRTAASPVGGSVLPTGMSDGYNVVWVSTDLDPTTHAALNVAGDGNYGRIMFQRFEVPFDDVGNPGVPLRGGIDGIAGLGDPANFAVELAVGRNPSTSSLHTFETGIVWVEKDPAGGERVAFRAYDDLGNLIPYANVISTGFPVTAGTNAHIVSAGAVNFVIAWVTGDATTGYDVMATMLSSPGTGLNGVGFTFGSPAAPFKIVDLPAGFNPAAADFQITGLSGEDSNDVVVSWNVSGDVMAQHVATAIDPVTGIALSMAPEGNQIVVHAATAGVQDHASIAGMLGERFFAVWHDTNTTYTDGNDILGRIIDTRDAVNPEPIVGDLVTPAGNVQARRDVIVGTNGNDDIKADISTSVGATDYVYGGMGDDRIQGGPGVRGAAGIPEIIDGGEGTDTSVYTGRFQDYSITLNGDGSVEVIDLRPTAIGGTPQPHDGIDNLFSIERLEFTDGTFSLELPGIAPPKDAGWDGTPVPWSLDDTSVRKEIAVAPDATPADATDNASGIAVTNLQDGAGLAWVKGASEVWAIAYDITGKPDPVLLDANTQLTDGKFAGNTVGDIDVAMSGGLGMTAVWESSAAGDSSIHMRFASTNTNTVLALAGGVPGPGLPGGEQVIVGSNGAGVAVDPVVQGYEIVDTANNTLEVGFHVGYVMKASAAATYGDVTIARYEIPVYDLAVDGAGLVVLDAAGQGVLARDGNGNLVPSTAATFGVGAETAPKSLGLDGLRGTADDGQAIVLTNLGLRAANNTAGTTVTQGRDISIGSLHDGQLVVTYIGTDEQVHLRMFTPTLDAGADRERTAGAAGTDIVATGLTTYAEFPLPFATTLGAVAAGQTAFVVPQQNGSFGVFWSAPDGANVALKGVVYQGAGTNWSPSTPITFASGLPSGTAFQVASTGVDPFGLENGYFVSWEVAGTGIVGQRFGMSGLAIGQLTVVGDPATGIPTVHSSSGIDDGRMIFGYADGNGVSAQYLDTRQAGESLIGPRLGALANVLVGTVGDDAIDGRALDDTLYGGLGNDLISLGSGSDTGFGGLGNDTILGASGQDQLLGEGGNDLLWGGRSDPATADAKVSLDLAAGLTAAGVSAAIINSNPGADLVSGGAGVDTLSLQAEFGRFNVNLATGIVMGDRTSLTAAGGATMILEDVIGSIVPNPAGGAIFAFSNDVENATGGLGDDTLIGNSGANVLDGREGNNTYDGAGGIDTIVVHGVFNTYTFTRNAAGTITVTDPGDTQTILNADATDFVQFDGMLVSMGALITRLPLNTPLTGAALVTAGVTNVNTAPTANADAATTLQGHAVTIAVLANDTDPNAAQALTIDKINGAALGAAGVAVTNGAVTLNNNGTLVFTPTAGFSGLTTFTYGVNDLSGGTATATVTVDVKPIANAINNGAATVTVTGAANERGTLTAVVGPDPDGAGTAPVIHWLRNGIDTGATGATFALSTADVGATFQAQAFYTDGEGFAEAPTSAATTAVVAVNDGAATVTVTGTANERGTLTATVGVDPDGAGTAPVIHWLRGAVDTGVTGATYALSTADVGATLKAQAFYTDGQGFAESPSSAATATVLAVDDGQALATVSGTATEGQVLSVALGADPDGPTTTNLVYQWFRGATAIAGATAATYTLRATDAGAAYSSKVTYTDAQGFRVTVDSNATTIVSAINNGVAPLTVTGTAAVGQTLTATLGADPDGAATGVAIAWFRGATQIASGATYVLTAADVGAVMHAEATYTDAQTFAETAISANTAVVAAGGGIVFNGGAGNETINGTAFADTLNGNAGNDTITGLAGSDVINGGAGTDTLVATVGDGNDSYDGGAGVDTYTLAGTTAAATVNLTLGTATSADTGTDTLVGVENVIGGSGADLLTGDANANTLNGGAGNDTLDGGTGGADTLIGGLGDDTFIVNRAGITITETAGQGVDTVRTSLNAFTLGANVDNLVYTGAAAINANGNNDANDMTGGAGNDTLTGLGGNDTLRGGIGVDTLSGGAGDDTLIGGTGNDNLTGGTGLDRFVFGIGGGRDTVTDFDANPNGGQDVLDISAYGFNATTFATQVTVATTGGTTTVTIVSLDGLTTDQIILNNVNGNGGNVISVADFFLG